MSLDLELVRKPPIGLARSDRLKITLDGRHTMKQKPAMLRRLNSGYTTNTASMTPAPAIYISPCSIRTATR